MPNTTGLYKPAVPDQQQDMTARTLRVKNSGSSISSPPYLLPYTKPFSGRPAGSLMTGPTRETGEALRSRSGIVYPLLPHAHRPDTSVVRRCRPSRASRFPTPGSTAHCSGNWKFRPATDAPCFQATRFQEALQKTPTQPLYCGIPAIQALTTPWALV